MPKKILVFDTETTGLPKPNRVPLDEQPRIIEIGLVVLNDDQVVERVGQLLDPKVPIPPDSSKTHHIYDDMVRGKPTFAQFLPEFIKHFEGSDCLIAHNAPFDVRILATELIRLGINETFPWPPKIICTVQEYAPMFGFKPNLQKLYQQITGKSLAQTHRALDDADALAEILIKEKWHLSI